MQPNKTLITTETSLLKYLQYIVFGSAILYFGRDIFIPLSFAMLISFVLYPVCLWLERKGFGKLTAIVTAITFLILLGLLLLALLVFQFISFLDEWPGIQSKLSMALTEVSETITSLGLSKEEQGEMISKVTDQSGGNILSLIKSTLSASVFSIVMLVLVPVYSILILYYRQYWMKILGRIFPAERSEALREMITLTVKAYYDFIKGMALVYIVVGSLNSVGLLLLGVPHAILFGFIASILTFIPYVGIIIGSLLPIGLSC